MEFNFNINNYFKDEITKVGSRLIPDNYTGDRREVQDCLSKISYILTILGEMSARAQGLQKVITSGEKLRNSDHVVYILVDPKGGSRLPREELEGLCKRPEIPHMPERTYLPFLGYGAVLGMLKIGVKHLYVFDASGNSLEVTTKCVLDFYVHESKQRMGLGKKLFQHMLKEERVDPVHLAIDKPSSKFLSFLLKHYGLQKVIPQMNNFVVFDGFFSNRSYGAAETGSEILGAGINKVDSRFSSGIARHNTTSHTESNFQSVSSINVNNPTTYYGRPAPHKPVSTMGMILQHKTAPSQQPPSSGSSVEEAKPSEAEGLTPKLEELKVENGDLTLDTGESVCAETVTAETPEKVEESAPVEMPPENEKKIFTSETLADDQKSPTETTSEKIRVNSQGYMDLKFYHSSLW